jgi:hypothetical protein
VLHAWVGWEKQSQVGDIGEERRGQQLEKQKANSLCKDAPRGLLRFLSMVGWSQWLDLGGEPRSRVSCILYSSYRGHRGKSGQSTKE